LSIADAFFIYFFASFTMLEAWAYGKEKIRGAEKICPTFSDCARPVPKKLFVEEINFGDPPVAKKISVSVPF
jgi:hypothetical protein